MIYTMEAIEVINEKSGTHYIGSDIEYFLDDTTDIGEVYLDGNLIYQSTSVYNEEDLKKRFNESFSINKQESTDA